MFPGELVLWTHLTFVPCRAVPLLHGLVRWPGCCSLVSPTAEKSRRGWLCWDCGAALVPSAVPLPPCWSETWRSVLSLLCSGRKQICGRGGDRERSGNRVAPQPQGSVCFLFGRGQGVQPDGNTTGTSPALGVTRLPIQGEARCFLVGLKMAGTVSQRCPVAVQDGPRSQVASWRSASCQGRGRCLWWRK